MKLRRDIFMLIAAFVMLLPFSVSAQDSTHVITVKDITPRTSIFKKLNGKFMAVPHYSSELGAGVALQFAFGTPLNIIGNITTEGYTLIGITGSASSKNKKWDYLYKGYYNYAPSYFWGFGYKAAEEATERTRYNQKKLLLQFDAAYHFSPHFRAGPSAGYEWIGWKDFINNVPSLSVINYGLFATFNSSKGVSLSFRQKNYTNLSGSSSFQINWYKDIWKGAKIATDLYSIFTYGNVAETMLPSIGGTERMRGYYYGRYRDNNVLSAQIELRQHIWQVISAATWIGGANIWGDYGKFQWKNTLPNFGIGIRCAVTEDLKLRFDYGFGKKGQSAFIFSINEAF